MDSATFDKVCEAIAVGRVHVSEHAYDEAVDDDIEVIAVIDATLDGEVIEDYPADPRGASCLVVVRLDPAGSPVHAVWGYDVGSGRAVLITVYRPDERRWSSDFRTRRPKQ